MRPPKRARVEPTEDGQQYRLLAHLPEQLAYERIRPAYDDAVRADLV